MNRALVSVVPGVAAQDMDDAFAYGFIGATIGHEMTHAFDDQGRKFDGAGNLDDWWTPAATAAFEARVEPLVKRYAAESPLPGMRINGRATLGENIADLGGLAIALDAFKRTECHRSGRLVGGFTPMQRFFIAYAYSWAGAIRAPELRSRLLSDSHSPAAARVNLVAPNFAEFHEAFGVKPGDRSGSPPSGGSSSGDGADRMGGFDREIPRRGRGFPGGITSRLSSLSPRGRRTPPW